MSSVFCVIYSLWMYVSDASGDHMVELDTIYRRHRVRFRSDHHTHQHTHYQQNFHKHHTDGRKAEQTKGQDA